MSGARSVGSNQESIHKDLDKIVRKYARTQFMRPVAHHTQEAFAQAEAFIQERGAEFFAQTEAFVSKNAIVKAPTECAQINAAQVPVVIDSGCGTGESTIHLARRFPDCIVIGIDKSCARLDKAGNSIQLGGAEVPRNALWLRAELLDFWKLVFEAKWNVRYHSVFYPNPWPKQAECTRRFHMHPIFPTMISIAPVTELRTNWEIYAQEFKAAAEILREESATRLELSHLKNIETELSAFTAKSPETAFERKYAAAGQPLWRVIVKR